MPVLSSRRQRMSAYFTRIRWTRSTLTGSSCPPSAAGQLPTIAAYAYKKSVGQPFLYPDNSLTLVENFLRMTFASRRAL